MFLEEYYFFMTWNDQHSCTTESLLHRRTVKRFLVAAFLLLCA